MPQPSLRYFYAVSLGTFALIVCVFLANIFANDAIPASAVSALADTRAPGNPAITSPSHTTGQWSSDNTIDINIVGASDGSASYESQITVDDSYQDQPVIEGDKVVWQDYRNGNWDIYMYDLTSSSESRITSNQSEQSLPDIYSDKIVWSDYRNGNADVYMYDITASAEIRLSSNSQSQTDPVIYGDNVVWQDNRHGNWDIYAYNLTASSETRITTNSADQLQPAIYGDKIVWQDHRNGSSDIFMYDLALSAGDQITTSDASQNSPQINGDRIVWHDNRNGNWDVYLFDLLTSTEYRLTSRATDQYFPDIYGDLVVWQDARNGNEDIFLFDLISQTETRVVTGDAHQYSPSIYEERVVWQDMRAEVPEVFLYQAPVAGSGVDGFSYSFTNNPEDIPDTVKDIEQNISAVTSSARSDGTWYFHLRTKDNDGNWSSAVHAGPYHIDTSSPDTTITGGPAGTIASRDVTFTWSGSDILTASPDLKYSFMLTSVDADWSSFDASLSKTYSGLANGSYVFKVRARDMAGNVDLSPAESAFTVNVINSARFEETSGNIIYSSNCWSNYVDPLLSGGASKISKKKGCTARFSYTGKQVDFISAKAKQLGKTKVYIDNVYQSTLDLYRSSTSSQQVVYTKSHASSGAHVLKIEVLATKNFLSSGFYIPIDAFDVSS